MTPEGRTKAKIKACLHAHGIFPASKAGAFPEQAQGWYFLPVSSGHGVHGVPDVIGHVRGRALFIEAKAPGKKPTGFQALQIAAIRAAGGMVFIIDGDLSELEAWLCSSTR
jgi:hypothetical protein